MGQKSGTVDVGLVAGGVFSIDLSGGDHTLVQSEWENRYLVVSGNPGAGRNLILPAALEGYEWTVENGFSTAQTCTLKVTGQTGVAVAQNKAAFLRGTTTDVKRLTADV